MIISSQIMGYYTQHGKDFDILYAEVGEHFGQFYVHATDLHGNPLQWTVLVFACKLYSEIVGYIMLLSFGSMEQ